MHVYMSQWFWNNLSSKDENKLQLWCQISSAFRKRKNAFKEKKSVPIVTHCEGSIDLWG